MLYTVLSMIVCDGLLLFSVIVVSAMTVFVLCFTTANDSKDATDMGKYLSVFYRKQSTINNYHSAALR